VGYDAEAKLRLQYGMPSLLHKSKVALYIATIQLTLMFAPEPTILTKVTRNEGYFLCPEILRFQL
jgi:hypothetical protein